MRKLLSVLMYVLVLFLLSCNTSSRNKEFINYDFQDSYVTIELIIVNLKEKLSDSVIKVDDTNVKGSYYFIDRAAITSYNDFGEDHHHSKQAQEFDLIIFLEQGIIEKINTTEFYIFQHRRNIAIDDKTYTLCNVILDGSKPNSYKDQYWDFLAYDYNGKLVILDEDCGYLNIKKKERQSSINRFLLVGKSVEDYYEFARKISIDERQFIVKEDIDTQRGWYLIDVLCIVKVNEKISDTNIVSFGKEIEGAYYSVECNTLSNYSYFGDENEKCIFISSSLLTKIDISDDLFLIASCPKTITINNQDYQVIYELLDADRPEELKECLWDFAGYIVDNKVQFIYTECGYLKKWGIPATEIEYLANKGILNGMDVKESIISTGDL